MEFFIWNTSFLQNRLLSRHDRHRSWSWHFQKKELWPVYVAGWRFLEFWFGPTSKFCCGPENRTETFKETILEPDSCTHCYQAPKNETASFSFIIGKLFSKIWFSRNRKNQWLQLIIFSGIVKSSKMIQQQIINIWHMFYVFIFPANLVKKKVSAFWVCSNFFFHKIPNKNFFNSCFYQFFFILHHVQKNQKMKTFWILFNFLCLNSKSNEKINIVYNCWNWRCLFCFLFESISKYWFNWNSSNLCKSFFFIWKNDVIFRMNMNHF